MTNPRGDGRYILLSYKVTSCSAVYLQICTFAWNLLSRRASQASSKLD